MHDWELRFKVNVKETDKSFNIPINWHGGTSYDWDISIDWSAPVRYQGNKSSDFIGLNMSVGKHYVKISPHNWITAGWARCLGNWNAFSLWDANINRIEFSMERLPWYAFMKSENDVGDRFLESAWRGASSLISMPKWFSLPDGITSLWDNFFDSTWSDCTSLTSIPDWFNIPQGITDAGYLFLSSTWDNCTSLTSNHPAKPLMFPNFESSSYWSYCFWWTCPIEPDTPAPGSSVMIKRN